MRQMLMILLSLAAISCLADQPRHHGGNMPVQQSAPVMHIQHIAQPHMAPAPVSHPQFHEQHTVSTANQGNWHHNNNNPAASNNQHNNNWRNNDRDRHHHFEQFIAYPYYVYPFNDDSYYYTEPSDNGDEGDTWVGASGGDVPDNAVSYQADDGSTLYRCRGQYQGQTYYGALKPQDGCYIQIELGTLRLDQYEVLVQSS